MLVNISFFIFNTYSWHGTCYNKNGEMLDIFGTIHYWLRYYIDWESTSKRVYFKTLQINVMLQANLGLAKNVRSFFSSWVDRSHRSHTRLIQGYVYAKMLNAVWQPKGTMVATKIACQHVFRKFSIRQLTGNHYRQILEHDSTKFNPLGGEELI